MICWKCKADIGDFDNYCKYCGTGQGKHVSFYYKIWGMWLLYLFIGPFAIYFVVRSPVIGKWTKWIFSLIMVLLFCWFSYKLVVELKNIADIYLSLLDMPLY